MRLLVAVLISLVVHATPDFHAKSLNGETVDLKSYRGHVVLLDFWASWCAPCLTEMPHLVELQKKYPDLKVVGISMDDDDTPVKPLIKKFKVNYPIVMGDEKVGELFGGILGLPVVMLIDRKGEIVKRDHTLPSERELKKLLTP